MKRLYINLFSLVIIVLFTSSCSVGQFSDLWPTDQEDNNEVEIREIATESFDPEDMEEIEVPYEIRVHGFTLSRGNAATH